MRVNVARFFSCHNFLSLPHVCVCVYTCVLRVCVRVRVCLYVKLNNIHDLRPKLNYVFSAKWLCFFVFLIWAELFSREKELEILLKKCWQFSHTKSFNFGENKLKFEV